jgi:hypothetical protein
MELESPWPVHGSVLVEENVVYLAAGRSSYLDGGVYVYALDPETGKLLKKREVYSPDPDTHKMPQGDRRTVPGVLADILISDGSSIYMRQMKMFDAGKAAAPHVLSTAGFLDGSWFNRTQWSVAGAAYGQLLLSDGELAYGVQAYSNSSRKDVFRPGEEGYLLFASELKPLPGRKSANRRNRMRTKWSLRVPVRLTAMVLAGKTLFAAGPPDVFDLNDPLGAFEGRKGAVLWVVSALDGEELAEYKLDSPPVFDGMIAAGGRLYISTRDGRLLCMGNKK